MMLSNTGTPFNEHGFGLIIADMRRLELSVAGGSNDMNAGGESVSQENLEDTRVSYEARQLWSVPITSQLPENGQVLTYDATSNQWGPGTISVSGYLQAANNLSDLANVATARTNLGVLAIANNLSDLANAGTARTNLGLGTIATQAANNVTITGGSISGITDLAVADGGTGASSASSARTNLGIGNIAIYDVTDVTPSSDIHIELDTTSGHDLELCSANPSGTSSPRFVLAGTTSGYGTDPYGYLQLNSSKLNIFCHETGGGSILMQMVPATPLITVNCPFEPTSLWDSGSNGGFYGTTGRPKATVTGSRGGNAALASLLTELASYGLITNSTS